VILEGLKLMILGMVIVYLFLILLFLAITAMGRILPEEKLQLQKHFGTGNIKNNKTAIIAAITVAVNAFRKNKK